MTLIDKEELLAQLDRLEKFNNSNVPEWVSNVIIGAPRQTIRGDLISRKDAIDVVRQYCIDNQIEDGDYHSNGIEYELNNLPSTEPEIIRCKDCKHYAGEGMYCTYDIIVQFDHFYCYYAERREDAD